MLWILSVSCLCLLGAMLWGEWSGNRLLRSIGKTSASICFVAIGLLAFSLDSSYSRWIILGLVFGAIGDVALLFDSQRAFLIGLVSFLLGHIGYVVAFAFVVPLGQWFGVLSIAPCIAALLVLVYLWPHLGSMRLPVIAYVTAIVLMVQGAMAVYQMSPIAFGAWPARLALVGAILFFASDISVAKGRFVQASFVDKAWGLPAYYLGQLCIAWSLS